MDLNNLNKEQRAALKKIMQDLEAPSKMQVATSKRENKLLLEVNKLKDTIAKVRFRNRELRLTIRELAFTVRKLKGIKPKKPACNEENILTKGNIPISLDRLFKEFGDTKFKNHFSMNLQSRGWVGTRKMIKGKRDTYFNVSEETIKFIERKENGN